MIIPNKSDFQPSGATLQKWLATRKPKINIEGVSMPGFLADEGNSDYSWFILAMIIEFGGLFLTIYGGAKSGGVFMFFAILLVSLFIILDLVFANKLHRNEAKKNILETRKIVYNADAATIKKLDLEIKEGSFLDFIYQTVIVLIALFKVVGIFLLGTFNILILYVIFAIIYLVVAYIHIRHTGYFFAYRNVEKALQKEYIDFANGKFKAITHCYPYSTSTALRLPIKHNPHEIIVDDPPKIDTEYKYQIIITGILTDDDIINLIASQDSNIRILLFKKLRKIQLESLTAVATG